MKNLAAVDQCNFNIQSGNIRKVSQQSSPKLTISPEPRARADIQDFLYSFKYYRPSRIAPSLALVKSRDQLSTNQNEYKSSRQLIRLTGSYAADSRIISGFRGDIPIELLSSSHISNMATIQTKLQQPSVFINPTIL